MTIEHWTIMQIYELWFQETINTNHAIKIWSESFSFWKFILSYLCPPSRSLCFKGLWTDNAFYCCWLCLKLSWAINISLILWKYISFRTNCINKFKQHVVAGDMRRWLAESKGHNLSQLPELINVLTGVNEIDNFVESGRHSKGILV